MLNALRARLAGAAACALTGCASKHTQHMPLAAAAGVESTLVYLKAYSGLSKSTTVQGRLRAM